MSSWLGGQPSQPAATSSTNTTSNIAPWAQPGIEQLISSGLQNAFPSYNQATGVLGTQSGYTPFNTSNAAQTITDPATGNQIANPNYDAMTATAAAAGKSNVADFTGLQNQSFNTAGNMQVPGQYGQATSLTGMAAQGNLGTIAGAGQYGQAGYNAGMGYGQNATNANAVNAYMNPYWQAALQPGLNLLNQQYGIQQNNNATQATQAGAFGGSRMGIQQGLTNQANQLAQQQMIGTGLNNAFNTAQQNMQQAATLGMQGAQQGLTGINAQQAGYNNAATAGVNMANIAGQQLGAQQSIAGLQNAYGAQQQQQAQNVINQGAQNYSTMQAYPMQQLSQLESMYTGVPSTTTIQNYQAPPNMLSQVAGLGLAGAGLMGGSSSTAPAPKANKKGGQIKEGGIDKLPAKNLESFKEGGITGGRMEDGELRFDVAGSVKGPVPVGSYEGGPFTAADYSLGTQDPRIYRDSQLNPSQKFNRTQLQLLEQSPGSGASLTGYPNANSGAVLGGQQYPKLSPGVLSQFLQAQQNLPDSSAVTKGPTSMDNIAANGNPDGQQQNTAPYTYKAPQVGLPNLLSTSSMSAADAKKNADQFIDLNAAQKEAQDLRAETMASINQRRMAREAADASRPTLGKKAEERLDKEDARDAQRFSDLKNASMLEAGLAVLGGTSPFFGPNISNAKEGIKSYKEGLKDIEKAKEARDNMRSNIEGMRDAQLNNNINAALQFEDNAANASLETSKHIYNANNNFRNLQSGIASNLYQTGQHLSNAAAIANLNAQTHVMTANAAAARLPDQIIAAQILGKGNVNTGFNMLTANQNATSLQEAWSKQAFPSGNMNEPNQAFIKAYPTPDLYAVAQAKVRNAMLNPNNGILNSVPGQARPN